MMMVVEKPAVELGLPERCLDRVELHVQSILPVRFAAHASCQSADFCRCTRPMMRDAVFLEETALTMAL